MRIRSLFIGLLLIRQAVGQDYLWPTDAGKVLTSSFAESRENRFHAGIDVKTWGRSGYKVFAIRSGYLSRIQVSPFGYGRVLYQTLDTGETAVYAHLSGFAPAIQEAVERKQEALGRYSITLFPAQDQFPLQKGDLIGYTGESGVGYPHLHFELRDKASRPINPFTRGYVVSDRVAPIVQKISVTPLSADSRVQGDLRPWLVQPRQVSPGRYQVEQPIRVRGMIAFGLDAYDQMEGGPNEFGTYRNRLWIGDQELFSAKYDRFRYDDNPQANLDRDYRLLAKGKGFFYKLFRDHGNELDFYQTSELYGGVAAFDEPVPMTGWFYAILEKLGLDWRRPAGVVNLPMGSHPFRIEAEDYWGNQSIVTGELLAERNSPAKTEGTASASDDSLKVNMQVEYYDDYCRLEFTFSNEPQGGVLLEGRSSPLTRQCIRLERKGPNCYLAGWPLNQGQPSPLELQLRRADDSSSRPLAVKRLYHHTVAAGSAQTVESEDGRCRIEFTSSSLFKPLFVRISVSEASGRPRYDMVSPVYVVEPEDVALADKITLAIRTNATDTSRRGVGLYLKERSKNEWSFIGRGLDQGQSLVFGSAARLGSFVLIRDLQPPAILSMSPAPGAQVTDRTPLLTALFKDEVAGMGSEEQLQLLLDGRKVIAEYDPEDEALRYQVKRALSPGRHEFECRVSDRCGNRSRKSANFWVK